MTHQELAQQIFNIAHLKGDFLLRSGQRSTEYFDKYRFESDPKILQEIAKQMVKLIPPGTEYRWLQDFLACSSAKPQKSTGPASSPKASKSKIKKYALLKMSSLRVARFSSAPQTFENLARKLKTFFA
jgi:hypothetical protein